MLLQQGRQYMECKNYLCGHDCPDVIYIVGHDHVGAHQGELDSPSRNIESLMGPLEHCVLAKVADQPEENAKSWYSMLEHKHVGEEQCKFHITKW